MRPIHHTKDTVMILDDISELTTPAEGPVVSLYLPTEYKRLRTNKERIEMKDLMKEAKHEIDANYAIQPNNKILVHLEDVINAPDEEIWLNAEASVALFADKDHVYIANLYHKVDPQVFVGDNWELSHSRAMNSSSPSTTSWLFLPIASGSSRGLATALTASMLKMRALRSSSANSCTISAMHPRSTTTCS